MTAATNRRDLLSFGGAAAALGAAVVVGATTLAADAVAAGSSPFAIGHARWRAVEARYNGLRGLAEADDERETDFMIAEWRAFLTLRPATAHEFVQAFLALTDDGKSEIPEHIQQRFTADAKRLVGAA